MLLFVAVIPLTAPLVETAQAMSAFSRKYGMKCDSCHRQRIPELNDFGVEFYRNGFTLPGKEGSAKKSESGAAGEARASGKEGGRSGEEADKPAPSRSAAPPGAASDSEEDESEEPEEVPPPPPTVVYRLPSRDGSVYFTDNPVRKDDVATSAKKQERRPAAPRSSVSRPVKAPPGAVASLKPPVHSKGAAPVRQERFRSYGECMERTLLEGAVPNSAAETMERLTVAEQRCSAYQVPER
uniref:Cytochrome C n=1 Tax=Geobacter metallireducens TaxID=28232 RepID=A0A831UA51_GEOME